MVRQELAEQTFNEMEQLDEFDERLPILQVRLAALLTHAPLELVQHAPNLAVLLYGSYGDSEIHAARSELERLLGNKFHQGLESVHHNLNRTLECKGQRG